MRNRTLSLLVGFFVAFCGVGLWLTRTPAPAVPVPPSAEEAPPPAEPAPVARLQPPAAVARPASPLAAVTLPAADLLPRPIRPAPIMDPHATALASGPPARPGNDEAPSSAGSLQKEDIRRAIESVTPLIRQCFEDAAERFPPPQNVVLSFTIKGQGISGHFDEGTIKESTIQDPWVQSCFLDALTDARFPVPEGGGTVSVTYPFRFSPSPPDGGSAQ